MIMTTGSSLLLFFEVNFASSAGDCADYIQEKLEARMGKGLDNLKRKRIVESHKLYLERSSKRG